MSSQRSATARAHLPPEIAFLRAEGVEIRLLHQAAADAARAGTDAATALLNAGLMEEAAYYRALARALGVPYLDGPIPFGPGLRFPESLVAGLAPLAPGLDVPCVLAPPGRVIAVLLGDPPRGLAAITSPTHLREAVFAAIPGQVADHAAQALVRHAPGRATAREPVLAWLMVLALALAAGLCLCAALPAPLARAVVLTAQGLFLAMTTFRLAALAVSAPVTAEAPPLADADLPVYTVLVPLYREAAVVRSLLRALAALDYPPAKLDIKLLLEDDDQETRAVLARIPLPARFAVITVPPGGPRTKPRALNAGLPLARGDLLTVYDAEDEPDPGQLRLAAAAFARLPERTACLQGRLVIDNAGDSRLTRAYALEYTGLFDVLNPALARYRLPIPLGGTSMHLRVRVLRALGGWDPYNVTEDADLGMRLALAGYTVGDLPSSTAEEAPARFRPWLAQRTRWLKGLLQTSLTHGRSPLSNARSLGGLEALCAAALVPGTVASALAYPVCLAAAAWTFLIREIPAAPVFLDNLDTGLAITLFGLGLSALVLPALLGCARRGWGDLAQSVPWMPIYYLLVSLAAWLALIELIRAPQRWNKTQHGLARTSLSGRPRHPERTGAGRALGKRVVP
ncbi:Glycosyltransferase, catalytic subunit of cellulose synthase and poly-beta-1,6-N-acetylglucosamine synthase [Methylobacterium phyllostachyos]|uniref:Glycosyltransferase, catalytic subunit of cellulose synthase and poly-beta-1,6-N-acetylglucosamine synthase n=1 Tax=Methylobacterium phyllostachyos TaxID=582672 RepID=A0A1H0B437_9HYPH|nr:glycosyltransferase [Methylobacterium phyllostachyos]SDN40143.1 Glycosyltransferase, catalytic subunit of cellulose synthase and poly-beta-1,6-N-acetylglucosamine synthase [Methylobacterium phyllostachyos]